MIELERRNEELAKDNAALDTENEKYWGMYSTSPAHGGRWVMGDVLSGLPSTEEVDELRRKIEELEGRLEVNHSVMPEWQCVCVCVCVCVCMRACTFELEMKQYFKSPCISSYKILFSVEFASLLFPCCRENQLQTAEETHHTLCLFPILHLRRGTSVFVCVCVVGTLGPCI